MVINMIISAARSKVKAKRRRIFHIGTTELAESQLSGSLSSCAAL